MNKLGSQVSSVRKSGHKWEDTIKLDIRQHYRYNYILTPYLLHGAEYYLKT